MRHHNANRKFGRVRKQRRALLSGLASSLILKERIKTTEAKAKELRPYVEKLVTKARPGTIASLRLVSAKLDNEGRSAKKLVNEIVPRYKERKGGYTRITKLGTRKGDAAKMAVIEFV